MTNFEKLDKEFDSIHSLFLELNLEAREYGLDELYLERQAFSVRDKVEDLSTKLSKLEHLVNKALESVAEGSALEADLFELERRINRLKDDAGDFVEWLEHLCEMLERLDYTRAPKFIKSVYW